MGQTNLPKAAAAKDEVDTRLKSFKNALGEYDVLASMNPLLERVTVEVELGDAKFFNLFLGKRVLRNQVNGHGFTVPVYSANVFEPMGRIEKSNIRSEERRVGKECRS